MNTAARPPKGKTLILHIGDHKTGSTTLQNAFATGQVFLEGATLLYPAKLNHNHLLGPFRAEAANQTSSFVAGPGSSNLTTLRQQIKETDADYILLSAEQFENLEAADFKRVTDRWFADIVDRVRVVAYARPHAQRFVSNFAELVKIGAIEGGMDVYLERIQSSGRYHFATRFGQWREMYGDDFVLRPMIRDQLYNGSVVDDFVHHAFDGHPFRLGEFARDNQSIGVMELMFLKFIQARFSQKQKFIRHTMAREIMRHMGAFTTGQVPEKLRLHRDLALELRRLYEADAGALDQAFFDGQPWFQNALEQACETAIAEPASLEPSDYFTAEELRYLTALREILWNAMQTPGNWAALFHQNRIDALHRATPPDSTV